MKKAMVCAGFLLMQVFYAVGQDHETVLKAPDDWQHEIIPFPISFAEGIDLVGFEDLRFTPNWSDSTHQNFWSYMFVWYVDKSSALTEETLVSYFNQYYDGLMRVNEPMRNALDYSKPKTVCHFERNDKGFYGEMHVFDNFFTKEPIQLNIRVSEQFCEKTGKQIIRCDISPQSTEHEVWTLFEQVSLLNDCE